MMYYQNIKVEWHIYSRDNGDGDFSIEELHCDNVSIATLLHRIINYEKHYEYVYEDEDGVNIYDYVSPYVKDLYSEFVATNSFEKLDVLYFLK